MWTGLGDNTELFWAVLSQYLPEPVWRILAELSYFFRQLYAK
jgi:hypothetical protein